jgi:hypothetical protein
MKKCESSDCTNAAEWDVFWPGQRTVLCERCRKRAQGIADVMGFQLSFQLSEVR